MKNGDPLSSRLRSQLGRALHQRYRNRRLAFHLYCALANREPLKARQEILLMLARNAERSAATDAIRLLRLNLSVIAHNKAAWQDWVIVGSCSALIPLVSSAVLAARFMAQIDTRAAANDECFPASQTEMSYMSWHGYMTYRDFSRYRV